MQTKSNLSRISFLMVACLAIFTPACRKDNLKFSTYTLLKPIYKSKSAVLNAINGSASQAFETPGKIYIRDNYIFLNELDKGIHIIDNSNPSRPVQTGFLNIPGNREIAVKGNTLYADMYMDLLAINITDLKNVSVTSRIPELFKTRRWVSGIYVPNDQVITGWFKKDTTVQVDPGAVYYADNCSACLNSTSGSANNTVPQSNKSNLAGSMAGMVMVNNYLYALTDYGGMSIIDANQNAKPALISEMYTGSLLETIYPFKDKLFLGANDGMSMYDLTDPSNPVLTGNFSHAKACDPVISDGQFAYVTLHTGSFCGGSVNEMDIVNVENLASPFMIRSYQMTAPTGLCKDGNLLFVCDGSSGVKLFDASQPTELKLLKQIDSKEPYDIIAANNKALVVAADGLYQYDYSDIQHIRLLSSFLTRALYNK